MAMSPGGWLYENRVTYAKMGYEAGIGKPENRLSTEDRIALAKRIYAEGKGLASMSPEEKVAASAKGGEISGNLNKINKTGVCGIPPEEHSRRMAETNKQKWVCPACGYTNIARHVNKHMAEEHNLPKEAKQKMVG
jgi:rubrerythrin